MKVNKYVSFLLIIVCFFCFSFNVFAITLGGTAIEIDHKDVIKYYTNSSKLTPIYGNNKNASGSGSSTELMTVDGQIAYCIEIGVEFSGGEVDLSNPSSSDDMYEYFYNGFVHKLVGEKYKNDYNKIREAIMDYLRESSSAKEQKLHDDYVRTERDTCGGAGLCLYEWYVEHLIPDNINKLASDDVYEEASAMAKELVRIVSLYITYGNEYIEKTTSVDKKMEYLLATQQSIWQSISDTGFYESLWYVKRAGAGFIIADDFHWSFDGEKRGDETELDVSDEIDDIETAIANHDKTPSMCSSKYQLALLKGESVSYTDTNGVLSKYNVTCTGNLKCITEGNNLTITSIYNGGNQKVYFNKKGSSDTLKVYRTLRIDGWPYQGIVYGQGTTDDVSCEMGQESEDLGDLTCAYSYHHLSTRTLGIDIYDMENNLIANETLKFDKDVSILSGTYSGLHITDTQKAEVWVDDLDVILKNKYGDTISRTLYSTEYKSEFQVCRKKAIKKALENSNNLSTGILNFGGSYTIKLTNSNDIDESDLTILSSEATRKKCYTINSITNQQVIDVDCKFTVSDENINWIINKAVGGVNKIELYLEYEYKKLKTCINVKTGIVRYIANSNLNCSSDELEVENDTIKNEEHWHYFVPLNSKSNSNVSVKMIKNYVPNEIGTSGITVKLPMEQKFYLETRTGSGTKLYGFNFYYKPIDIDNPFPNINLSDICSSGMSYESLWGSWLLAKCSNYESLYGDVNCDGLINYEDLDYLMKYLSNYTGYELTGQCKINADMNNDGSLNNKDLTTLYKKLSESEIDDLDLSKSFDMVTYVAANINAKTVRKYTEENPYTSWMNMSPNGLSQYITDYGVIKRNGVLDVFKLGCGPDNENQYIAGTKNENPLYIEGCN